MPEKPHEAALVNSFVRADRRRRVLSLLSSPKQRQKGLRLLADGRIFDTRFVRAIPPDEQSPEEIERLLRQRGASDKCYVVSELTTLDTGLMPLLDALIRVVGSGMGSILSCIPGKLAYYEGEAPGNRCILER